MKKYIFLLCVLFSQNSYSYVVESNFKSYDFLVSIFSNYKRYDNYDYMIRSGLALTVKHKGAKDIVNYIEEFKFKKEWSSEKKYIEKKFGPFYIRIDFKRYEDKNILTGFSNDYKFTLKFYKENATGEELAFINTHLVQEYLTKIRRYDSRNRDIEDVCTVSKYQMKMQCNDSYTYSDKHFPKEMTLSSDLSNDGVKFEVRTYNTSYDSSSEW